MKWDEFLHMIDDQPIFEPAMLFAGDARPAEVRRQLSRWVKAGKLYRVRRGLYAVAPPYAKAQPQPFAVAGRFTWPSYVSLQSALAYHGLIPEAVPVVTSVTTRRPGHFDTPLGRYQFRHVKIDYFWGYREFQLEAGQSAFIAEPEKALLDQCYLTSGADSLDYIRELRIDPEGTVVPEKLISFAAKSGSAKLRRFASRFVSWLESERKGRGPE